MHKRFIQIEPFTSNVRSCEFRNSLEVDRRRVNIGKDRRGGTSARQSREISKSILLALMSRDADRLLAYGEIPARCVAKVDCRVACPDSEYVPEYY